MSKLVTNKSATLSKVKPPQCTNVLMQTLQVDRNCFPCRLRNAGIPHMVVSNMFQHITVACFVTFYSLHTTDPSGLFQPLQLASVKWGNGSDLSRGSCHWESTEPQGVLCRMGGKVEVMPLLQVLRAVE